MGLVKKLGLADKRPRRFVLLGAAAILIWILLFDSHSIVRRVVWTFEARAVESQNDELRAEIGRLQVDIQDADEEEVVEKVARESYGMRRPGETVYRVETVTE
jgi:cell division protein FtsB